jgi:hypothetical protein
VSGLRHFHGTNVPPSGLFPSLLVRPVGSSTAGILDDGNVLMSGWTICQVQR